MSLQVSTPAAASAVEPLTVRQLQVDLRTPLDRRWHRNDFLTQFFNALSMSFPVGEQFFIDSARGALPLLPEDARFDGLRENLQRFIAQEASHRHIHAQYNAHLEAQGLVNHWQHWAHRRIAFAQRRGFMPLDLLAITCAYEHLTASLADITLRHDDCLQGAQERMQWLWRWHASEEIEHRSMAFDLYLAAGGRHGRRVRWFLQILATFMLESQAQTLANLYRSGSLWRLSTWREGLRFLMGRQGLLWRCAPALWAYLRKDFHPEQEPVRSRSGRSLAQDWLAAHRSRWRAIR